MPILLERGTGPDGVRIWRIAASTVERIPELYAEFGYGPLEPWLPRWFFELSLLGIALWQWCALLALVIGAWALSWIAVLILERGVRPLARRTQSDLDDRLVNATALLAGLGVGGIAVALAAQKTLENLFGGITLLADRPVSVGDFCRVGDRVGTIESIGLRYETTREQVRAILDALREMLLAHPRVLPDPARPEGAVAAPDATADQR